MTLDNRPVLQPAPSFPPILTTLVRCGALLCMAVALGACGSLPRNAAPPQRELAASIPGLPDIRAWGGPPSAILERDLALSFQQESQTEFPRGADGSVLYAHLALSGGGANGAFGAGFLNGWTATGQRPTFKIVTGVSTGALMAPFAFLGPDHDKALREFYTTTSSVDIFTIGSVLWQLLVGEALADTRPLQALIARHVDAELLRRVAEAHQRGRRLYIGTADLDVPRFVVWNMGLIASSGHPDALARAGETRHRIPARVGRGLCLRWAAGAAGRGRRRVFHRPSLLT